MDSIVTTHNQCHVMRIGKFIILLINSKMLEP